MRKPINFLIVNMIISDLLSSIFVIPPDIQSLYIDSWLIGGPLRQMSVILGSCHVYLSIWEMVLCHLTQCACAMHPGKQ